MTTSAASDLIAALNLVPHPEGGHFAETFRNEAGAGERAVSTANYYLLQAGERSHWHRVEAAEVWHFYAGAPLALSLSDGRSFETLMLGAEILAG